MIARLVAIENTNARTEWIGSRDTKRDHLLDRGDKRREETKSATAGGQR